VKASRRLQSLFPCRQVVAIQDAKPIARNPERSACAFIDLRDNRVRDIPISWVNAMAAIALTHPSAKRNKYVDVDTH